MPPTWTYEVWGSGQFPHDMLRYDGATIVDPAESDEALDLVDLRKELRGEPPGPNYLPLRMVTVQGSKSPTAARWQSFGWAVTNITVDKIRSTEP